MMTDIRRTRYYAMADGVEVVDGEFKKTSYVVGGRFKDLDAANFAVRRLYPNFLPKDIKIFKQQGVMPEDEFFQYAHTDDPVILESSLESSGDEK